MSDQAAEKQKLSSLIESSSDRLYSRISSIQGIVMSAAASTDLFVLRNALMSLATEIQGSENEVMMLGIHLTDLAKDVEKLKEIFDSPSRMAKIHLERRGDNGTK